MLGFDQKSYMSGRGQAMLAQSRTIWPFASPNSDRPCTRARQQLACALASLAPVPGGFSQIESYKLEYAQVENEKGRSGGSEKQ